MLYLYVQTYSLAFSRILFYVLKCFLLFREYQGNLDMIIYNNILKFKAGHTQTKNAQPYLVQPFFKGIARKNPVCG